MVYLQPPSTATVTLPHYNTTKLVSFTVTVKLLLYNTIIQFHGIVARTVP